MENSRYIDQRALNHQGMLEKAKALQRSNGIFDLGNPRDVDFDILKKLHDVIEQSEIRPVKSQKVLAMSEFVEKLSRVCAARVDNGGVIVAEIGGSDGQSAVTIKGKVGEFYRAFFIYEKLREQIRKEDR